MATSKDSSKDYCGIIFIGGGSSWAWGPTPEAAAKTAARICKSDWKVHFKFEKRQEFTVNVYDMREHSGWYADHSGVYAHGTNTRLTVFKIIKQVA